MPSSFLGAMATVSIRGSGIGAFYEYLKSFGEEAHAQFIAHRNRYYTKSEIELIYQRAIDETLKHKGVPDGNGGLMFPER